MQVDSFMVLCEPENTERDYNEQLLFIIILRFQDIKILRFKQLQEYLWFNL